jgi:hypothetical protein
VTFSGQKNTSCNMLNTNDLLSQIEKEGNPGKAARRRGDLRFCELGRYRFYFVRVIGKMMSIK